MKIKTIRLLSFILILTIAAALIPFAAPVISEAADVHAEAADSNYSVASTELRFLDVSSGGDHVLALSTDGSVWAWGANAHGQLGDGTTTRRNAPVKVFDSAIAISAGERHSTAIKTDGSLWAWGDNISGKLGDGTTTKRLTPVSIMTNVKSVSAGAHFTLVIRTDGSLWSWGGSAYGSNGDGTSETRLSPVRVIGMDSGVTVASVGYDHSMAIKSDGSLWAWGYGWSGAFGNGVRSSRNTIPVQINYEAGMTNGRNVFVSASNDYSIIIEQWVFTAGDGSTRTSVYASGVNTYGRLGNGTTTNTLDFTSVSFTSGVTYVATSPGAYGNHTAAIRDGQLLLWGSNSNGQLGDGTKNDRRTPGSVRIPGSSISDSFNDVIAVSVGDRNTVFIRSDGSIWSWGRGLFGTVGDGTFEERLVPVRLSIGAPDGGSGHPPGDGGSGQPPGSGETPPPDTKTEQLTEFIKRLYLNVLGRAAEPTGVAYWLEELRSGRHNGSTISQEFFFSDEFVRKNTPDRELIDILYRTCMGREPDPYGADFWYYWTVRGLGRVALMREFLNSDEFAKICNDYNIERGHVTLVGMGNPPPPPPHPTIIYKQIEFIERQYRNILGREASEGDVNPWLVHIWNGHVDGAVLCQELLFSQEFNNRGLSDSELIDTMITVTVQSPDDKPRDFWVTWMSIGLTRISLMAEFINSNEFRRVCNDYEILPGRMNSDRIPLPPAPPSQAAIQLMTDFIIRLYRNVLGRNEDQGGLEFWLNGLLTRSYDGFTICEEFFLSDEFTGRNTTNEEFINILYNTCMDREADSSGMKFWLNELITDASPRSSRHTIMMRFLHEPEYKRILHEFGLFG